MRLYLGIGIHFTFSPKMGGASHSHAAEDVLCFPKMSV